MKYYIEILIKSIKASKLAEIGKYKEAKVAMFKGCV